MFQLLRRVLVAEINALQGMAAIGQRPLLMEVSASLLFQEIQKKSVSWYWLFFYGLCLYQEVNSVLQQVVERNRVRRSLSAKRHALQSWRSLVETILTACPSELIPADQRQLIIRDLLLDLHDKVGKQMERKRVCFYGDLLLADAFIQMWNSNFTCFSLFPLGVIRRCCRWIDANCSRGSLHINSTSQPISSVWAAGDRARRWIWIRICFDR